MGNSDLERTFFTEFKYFVTMVSILNSFIGRSAAYALLIGWLYLEKPKKVN